MTYEMLLRGILARIVVIRDALSEGDYVFADVVAADLEADIEAAVERDVR